MRAPLIILFMLLSAVASAQTGLATSDLFGDTYIGNQGVRLMKIEGGELKKMKLQKFYSFTVTAPDAELAASIESKVKRDGARAMDKEVQYKDKRLRYGFYQLRQAADYSNRYLVYLDQTDSTGGKILVIYLEGKASLNDVKKLIEKN